MSIIWLQFSLGYYYMHMATFPKSSVVHNERFFGFYQINFEYKTITVPI
jgi:hypothetical protein